MGFELHLLRQPNLRLDLGRSECHPRMSIAELQSVPVRHGNVIDRCDQWFRITPNDQADSIGWFGDLQRVDGIGSGWQLGRCEIHSPCGLRVAESQRGGTVEVWGDVGDDAGRGLKGGELIVHGTVGDRLGASLPGEQVGMRGGVIIVSGDAGDEVGSGMRRGIIYVGGNAGLATGWRMKAGTIAVAGRVGRHLGCDMVRGSILLGPQHGPLALSATFRPSATTYCTYAPILHRYLESKIGRDCRWLQTSQFQYWHGDFARTGKGEVLMAISETDAS